MLIAVLLLMVLLLSLTLLYTLLVRVESVLIQAGNARRYSRFELEQAAAEAWWTLEDQDYGRATLPEGLSQVWASSGSGQSLSNQVDSSLAQSLGLPQQLWGVGESSLWHKVSNAEWVIDGDTNDIHSAYAWVAVNLSGLMDPHALANFDLSGLGVNSNLSAGTYLSPSEFATRQSTAEPLFFPGIWSRDRGWWDEPSAGGQGWRTNTVIGTETLSMFPHEWSEAQWRAALEDQYGAGAELILTAAMDFVEGRALPRDPDGVTAVPVPMFNEAVSTLSLTNLGTQVDARLQLELELWYPFPWDTRSEAYSVTNAPPTFSTMPGLTLPTQASGVEWIDFNVSGGSTSNSFVRLTLVYVRPGILVTNLGPYELEWELDGLEIQHGGTSVVDRLPAGLRLRHENFSLPASGAVSELQVSLEALDPRHNHDLIVWEPADEPSLEAVNSNTVAAAAPEEWVMWTPLNRSSNDWERAWLGFLPLDLPWQTIHLEGGGFWYEQTRDADTSFGEWRRDRININGLYPDAQRAALRNAPLPRWPGDPNPPLLQDVTLEQIVGMGFSDWRNIDSFSTLSDAVRYFTVFGLSEPEAEALAEHAWDRFSLEPETWTLLLFAERRSPQGRVLGRASQLRWIWRDAFPLPDGRHERRELLRRNLP